MEFLRPNADRAKNAIVMIWVLTVIEIASFVSAYLQYDLLLDIKNGADVTEEMITANDMREMIIGAVLLVANIVCIITFIQWFRRAYFNLHQQIDGLSYSEGWAAGAWFVPIISLFRPYQIMRELYVETNHLLVHRGFGHTKRLSLAAIGWWWAVWILGVVVSLPLMRLTFNTVTIDDVISVTIVSMISNVITVPLAILATKVIRDYSRVEPLMHELTLDLEPAPTSPETVAEPVGS